MTVIVGRSRAALFALEREVADLQDLASAAQGLRQLAADVSSPDLASALGILADRLVAADHTPESVRTGVMTGVAHVCCQLHRDASFAVSPPVDDATYGAFLRAAVHEDKKLYLGSSLALGDVQRRARLPPEAVDAAAARAIEERLAYVQNLDGRPYALLLEHEDVAYAIAHLPRESSRAAVRERGAQQSMVDIGILTIKDEEFDAVLDVFQDEPGVFIGPKTRRHFNLRTADAGGGAKYRVAILQQVEQGQGEAQHAARDLIEELTPRLILVVGIAGGLPSPDYTLGDVILSLRIHDYSVEARKEGNDATYAMSGGPIGQAVEYHVRNLRARRADLGDWTLGLPPRPPVVLNATNFYGSEVWKRDVRSALAPLVEGDPRPPLFRSGVIASSDRLVKDTTVLIPWLESSRQLLAVEMESGGIYRAARERCSMLAIRGLSDLIGFKRDERWTRYACASAAAFARAYLRTTPVPPTSKGLDTGLSPLLREEQIEIEADKGDSEGSQAEYHDVENDMFLFREECNVSGTAHRLIVNTNVGTVLVHLSHVSVPGWVAVEGEPILADLRRAASSTLLAASHTFYRNFEKNTYNVDAYEVTSVKECRVIAPAKAGCPEANSCVIEILLEEGTGESVFCERLVDSNKKNYDSNDCW